MIKKHFLAKFECLIKLSLQIGIIFVLVSPTIGSEEEHDPHKRSFFWHHHKVHQNNYDPASHDLFDMMTKMHFEGTVVLVNDLTKQARVAICPRHNCQTHKRLSFVQVLKQRLEEVADAVDDFFEDALGLEDSSGDEEEQAPHVLKKSVINPEQCLIIKNFDPSAHEIQLQKPKSILNIISVKPGFVKLSIAIHQRPIFPLPLKDFDFQPHLFQPIENLADWIQRRSHELVPFGPQYPPCEHETEEQFRKDFDSHLIFMTMIAAPQEGIREATRFFNRRAELFQTLDLTNKLKACASVRPLEPKIPLVTHTIWLTNPSKPKEMEERHIDWLLHSLKVMPEVEGWEHCLWIQDNDLVPLTCERLKHTGIKVKQIYLNSACTILNPFFGKFKLKDRFEKAVSESKFGKATDILRVELIYRKGGVYKDTDYRFSQSLRFLNALCDGYTCVEPMSTFLGNALIAMREKHPVMKEAMRLIARNLSDDRPDYIRRHESDQAFATIMTTGPMMLSFAFHNAAGKDGNIDVAFPPAMFFPSVISQAYPQKEVLKPEDAVHPEAAGVHFWETSWANQKVFGSFG